MSVQIVPTDIIRNYYEPVSLAHRILVEHGSAVAEKSLEIARGLTRLNPDLAFIREAAMLHDIGMFMTRMPGIGCDGEKEYICHGYLGRELLEREGLPAHALVCERHVGAGLTIEDIQRQNLPVPRRDMLPVTVEEQIICYADKFFSKRVDALRKEKGIDEVRREIARYGPGSLERFDGMTDLLSR